MEFKEVLDRKLDKDKIALGARKGSMLTIDLNETSSIIITGETGAGKSVMINQILLQLTRNYKSDEFKYILIDTSGVELQKYDDTNYTIMSAFNDLDKSQKILFNVLEEIDRRKDILRENSLISINEYNDIYNKNIPNLLVVVDDNQSLLNKEDVSSMVDKIIDSIDVRLNMIFVIATNNVYNEFFDNKKNRKSNILISFDHASEDDATRVGMPFSNDLLTGKFLVYIDGNYEEYNNFDFNEKIINEIID